MEYYRLTTLERIVFAEMADCNPGTTPEMIYKTCIHNEGRYIFHYCEDNLRPPLVDISPLVKLHGLDEVTLYQCAVQDISPLAQKIGNGFEIRRQDFLYKFPPLAEVLYNAEGIRKRFSHREAWCWEDDDGATGRKIAAATTNGQLELVDCGCGQSFRLIVCGGAKGEVWDMSNVGIAPYGNGLDFLDWLKDFLDGKVV